MNIIKLFCGAKEKYEDFLLYLIELKVKEVENDDVYKAAIYIIKELSTNRGMTIADIHRVATIVKKCTS